MRVLVGVRQGTHGVDARLILQRIQPNDYCFTLEAPDGPWDVYHVYPPSGLAAVAIKIVQSADGPRLVVGAYQAGKANRNHLAGLLARSLS